VTIETDFPGLAFVGAAATAEDADFFLDGCEIVVNRAIAARGAKEIFGRKPQVRRFCSRATPDVIFRKEAHAVPELAGNGTHHFTVPCPILPIRLKQQL
jgi:hypothetical protein